MLKFEAAVDAISKEIRVNMSSEFECYGDWYQALDEKCGDTAWHFAKAHRNGEDRTVRKMLMTLADSLSPSQWRHLRDYAGKRSDNCLALYRNTPETIEELRLWRDDPSQGIDPEPPLNLSEMTFELSELQGTW